jgi:hypothetical protein
MMCTWRAGDGLCDGFSLFPVVAMRVHAEVSKGLKDSMFMSDGRELGSGWPARRVAVADDL